MNDNVIKISVPANRKVIRDLKAGDRVELSGNILVFRDQVHRILCEMISEGRPLPFSLRDAVLYYCGPTPARHGMPVGSAGPTTASRMDMFTAPLLEQGLAATIGKGNRSPEVAGLLKKHCAVYMVAVGGTGAFLAKKVIDSKVLAFDEFGTEAARKFTVKDLPLVVGIDSEGRNAFV
ncbi:MAG: TRZ/ATZ family protein [Candidatus Latescibacteria bacterium]|jgi:fumarate hydratase subunit beta|nr:TRZ/ATZ family protein [Candidatus Latescibacterota bacterium]